MTGEMRDERLKRCFLNGVAFMALLVFGMMQPEDTGHGKT